MLDPRVYYYFNLLVSFFWVVVWSAPAVIAYLIHRRWQHGYVRMEEINRKLVLASEETARAEFEASSMYVGADTVSVAERQFHCAVCFFPTTNRCSGCKSVHYCSGKCQIIHWRLGHKEKCHPSRIPSPSNDEGGISSLKETNQNIDRGYDDTAGVQPVKPVESIQKEPIFSDSKGAPKRVLEKDDDDMNVTFFSDPKETHSDSSCSFSAGFSSPSSKESCDDISVCGSTDSNDPEKVVEDRSAHAPIDTETTTRPHPNQIEPLISSNGFWEGAFNSNWSGKKAQADSTRFFSTVESDTCMADMGVNQFPSKPATSECTNIDAPKIESLPVSISKRSSNIVDDNDRNSCISRLKVSNIPSSSSENKSREADPTSISTGNLKTSSTSSLMSKSNNHFVKDARTSNFLEPKEHRAPSSSTSNRLISSKGGHTVPSAKNGKDDGVRSAGGNAYHIASNSPDTTNASKTTMPKVVDQHKMSNLSRSCSLVGNESARGYIDKGLFPYELFIKLYSWNKVELLPCGLTNIGNSCYANAVLQCLAFTQPLSAYLLQGFHSKSCVNKEWCFTCEFESLILKIKEGNFPLSPLGLLTHLRNTGSQLGNGREEDAHEFLRYIIDKMQSVCLKESGANASGSMIEETTLIGLTFGGYLRSKIECMKCHGKSECSERIMDLTVEIEGNIGTLEEALQKFTSTEILDGENKYHCSRCKSYEKAKKKLKILEAPNVLTIALKRFQSGRFGKLNKSIEFSEILDLAKYMSGTSDKSPIYKLYGVIVHLDVMNASFSGHYVCYVKNNQNRWFKIDDSLVQGVELKKVKEKGAYMLFYSRYSPRAPKLLRNGISRNTKLKVAMAKSGFPATIPSMTSSESIYTRHPMRTINEADSSSDSSSSLFSSCSDEGSCSTTESNRDSNDDLSDYIGFTNPWRNLSDSDASLSFNSSSMLGRHSPLADLDRYASSSTEQTGLQSFSSNSKPDNLEAKGSSSCSNNSSAFLKSDVSKPPSSKLVNSRSCRGTDSDRLGRKNLFEFVRLSVPFRTSKKRTS